MTLSWPRTCVAIVVASAGIACGSSDDASTNGDAGSLTDGGNTSQDGSAKTDGGGPGGDGGNSATGHPVNLGTASTYAILSMSGISTVPTSAITGDLGVSPATDTAITGFDLSESPPDIFWSSAQVTGKIYASTNAVPTPVNLTTAIGDMQTAFTDAAGRAPDVTELGAGNIGGLTLKPGVYKWGTDLLIPTDVTLSGGANDVWIFEIAQDLSVSSATKVVLAGGAVAKNIFWEVAGSANLDTTSHLEGVVLCQTSIMLRTGASIEGRLFAQTAVTLDGNAVVAPAP
jgi:hypothetical protein